MKHITLFLILLFLTGCQQRLTRNEWLKVMPPPTTQEEGIARGLLEKARAEGMAMMKLQSSLDRFMIICATGVVASVFAIVYGVKKLGSAGLIACLSGIVLVYSGYHYGKYLGMAGLVVAGLAAIYAAWIVLVALKQVVKGNELFKTQITSPVVVEAFKLAQRTKQKGSTAKIVAKIREMVT